ncbi:helix-turn-helix transcriptional regulator [Paracoccus sp. (in: a-proteobacteria)]|uniref:ArsR/SmtB family transcription factor n=1 Tax=Paracoccus sp. TaxID=267 RepID=UPI0026DF67BA|nr:winged helix-turn-helix domain-containing protein [Paracoccus sp. (in: a-proteobacteria)]MDO5648885.1 winged helix-turn-helix domain-containing protein [Paracoccus sp. (in: a-proteobacteria)]
MKEGPDIASIAALIGDPARANMLTALMSGRALTASELAREAGITQQTASAHLGRLEQGGLVVPRKQGRHKYVSLAGPEVAMALGALMGLAARKGQLRSRPGPRDDALRLARVCYNHLAGEMGTRLYDSFVAGGCLRVVGTGLGLTPAGEVFVSKFGIDLPTLRASRTPLCRECLDWSERRSHMGGSLGRALLTRFEKMDWAKREADTRVIRFSRSGAQAFERMLNEARHA